MDEFKPGDLIYYSSLSKSDIHVGKVITREEYREECVRNTLNNEAPELTMQLIDAAAEEQYGSYPVFFINDGRKRKDAIGKYGWMPANKLKLATSAIRVLYEKAD